MALLNFGRPGSKMARAGRGWAEDFHSEQINRPRDATNFQTLVYIYIYKNVTRRNYSSTENV